MRRFSVVLDVRSFLRLLKVMVLSRIFGPRILVWLRRFSTESTSTRLTSVTFVVDRSAPALMMYVAVFWATTQSSTIEQRLIGRITGSIMR